MARLPHSAERKAHGGFEPHGGCFAGLAQRGPEQERVGETLLSRPSEAHRRRARGVILVCAKRTGMEMQRMLQSCCCGIACHGEVFII